MAAGGAAAVPRRRKPAPETVPVGVGLDQGGDRVVPVGVGGPGGKLQHLNRGVDLGVEDDPRSRLALVAILKDGSDGPGSPGVGQRMVALAGKEAIGTWAQLEVLVSQWRAIEGLLSGPGPFIYSATR